MTVAASTTCKEGSQSASIAYDATFGLGVMATANLNANVDCSAYQQISFWFRPSLAVSAYSMAVALYSDDYPTSALTNCVGKVYVDRVARANLWMPITGDCGGSLGTVRTIALIQEIDQTAATLLIDDILACKAPTEDDSLTLTSLISKNTANEPWFAIGSINGTAVELESINAAPSSTIGSYGGTTETVETYKRETWKTTPVAATTTAVQTISDSGSDGSPITIAGGYTNGQDVTADPTGMSWFDGGNGYGYGIYATGKSYVTLSRLGAARYFQGIRFAGTGAAELLTNCYAGATGNHGFIYTGTHTACALTDCFSSGAVGYGLYVDMGGVRSGSSLSGCVVHGANSGGVCITSSKGVTATSCTANATVAADGYIVYLTYGEIKLIDCTAIGCGLAAGGLQVDTTEVTPAEVINFSTAGNTTRSLYVDNASSVRLWDSTLSDTTEVVFVTAMRDDYAVSTNHDDAPGSHYRWEYGATYNSQQAVRHTEDGWAWQLSPTNAARSSTWPLRLPIGQVYLASGVATTVTAWAQRSHADLTMSLVCPGGQITGVAADVSDSVAAAADTWEQLSIELTSTESGVVTIEVQAYGGTAYSGYVDDIASDQTGTFTGLDNGTGEGPVWINSATGGASAVTRVTGSVQ